MLRYGNFNTYEDLQFAKRLYRKYIKLTYIFLFLFFLFPIPFITIFSGYYGFLYGIHVIVIISLARVMSMNDRYGIFEKSIINKLKNIKIEERMLNRSINEEEIFVIDKLRDRIKSLEWTNENLDSALRKTL